MFCRNTMADCTTPNMCSPYGGCSGPSMKDRFDNYRIRRIEAYRAFELLEKVIDNLGVEDGSQLPLPDMPLPVTPSEAHKNEMRNAATALLRTILIWNDGNVSHSKLQRW
jgi:hypothetical protein